MDIDNLHEIEQLSNAQFKKCMKSAKLAKIAQSLPHSECVNALVIHERHVNAFNATRKQLEVLRKEHKDELEQRKRTKMFANLRKFKHSNRSN